MEENKNNATLQASQRPTADQYLATVVRNAEWIDVQYKRFSEKYRNNPLVMREIYLCACDKVPLDLMTIAEKKEPVDKSLVLCRRKHLESQILGTYSDELEEIRNIATILENDVKSISGTVNHIAENIPSFDEMFPMAPPSSNNIEMPQKTESCKKTEEMEYIPKQRIVTQKKTKEQGTIGKLTNKVSNLLHKVKRSPAAFVIDLYSKGYQDVQINFILDCIEEGLSEKDIMEFASPKISVEMMRKLKELHKKEREGNTHG